MKMRHSALVLWLCSITFAFSQILSECTEDEQYGVVENCTGGYRLIHYYSKTETCRPSEEERINCGLYSYF